MSGRNDDNTQAATIKAKKQNVSHQRVSDELSFRIRLSTETVGLLSQT